MATPPAPWSPGRPGPGAAAAPALPAAPRSARPYPAPARAAAPLRSWRRSPCAPGAGRVDRRSARAGRRGLPRRPLGPSTGLGNFGGREAGAPRKAGQGKVRRGPGVPAAAAFPELSAPWHHAALGTTLLARLQARPRPGWGLQGLRPPGTPVLRRRVFSAARAAAGLPASVRPAATPGPPQRHSKLGRQGYAPAGSARSGR